MSDWTTSDLKQKSVAATEYTDYANIPVGESTYEIPYTLLDQDQQLKIQSEIDMEAIADLSDDTDVDDEVEEAEEIVEELQSKDNDELTEEDEQQLKEAQMTLLKNRGQLVNAMGYETLKAFHDAGRAAIRPDSEDIENVLSTPRESKERFEDVDGAPTPTNGEWTREMAQRALRREMLSILDDVPFMIYFTIGQQVWEESQSAGKLVEN